MNGGSVFGPVTVEFSASPREVGVSESGGQLIVECSSLSLRPVRFSATRIRSEDLNSRAVRVNVVVQIPPRPDKKSLSRPSVVGATRVGDWAPQAVGNSIISLRGVVECTHGSDIAQGIVYTGVTIS